jgi:hypothetical protein
MYTRKYASRYEILKKKEEEEERRERENRKID